MNRWFVIWILSCGLSATVFAQQQKSSPPVWDLGIFQVPPGFGSSHERMQDVSPFLRGNGPTTPAGSEAWYDKAMSRLFLKNTPENLSLAESLIMNCGGFRGPAVTEALEIRIFECSSQDAESSGPEKLTYADLEKLPPDKIRLVDHFSILMRSGATSTLVRQDAPHSPEDSGSPTKAEIVALPDGTTAILTLTGQLGLNDSSSLSLSGSHTLRSNEPTILKVSRHSKTKGSTLVVTGIFTLENEGGWKLQSASYPNNSPSP